MSMRPTLLLALALLALPAAHAQRVTKESPAKSPPARSPVVPAPRRASEAAAGAATAAPKPTAAAVAAKSLADADVAFASRASSAGLRDALLATLADNALLFHPRAIPARPWVAATTSFPAGQYTWAPSWAAVSADGSFGVTTGPIVFRSATPDTSATGQYVTVWSRTPAGWRVLLQLTVPGPQQVGELTFTPHQPLGDGRPRGGPGAAEGSRATLFIADRGLAAAAEKEGAATAIGRLFLPDARVLRAGRLPAIGVDSARAALVPTDPSNRFVWQTGGDVYMARSGELGVTLGIYEFRNPSGGVTQEGNFVRVWERQPDGGWRILLDAAAPTPPQ
jgi:ketosteroid isomerase-like protein